MEEYYYGTFPPCQPKDIFLFCLLRKIHVSQHRRCFLLIGSLGKFFVLVGIGKSKSFWRNFIKELLFLIILEKSFLVIGIRKSELFQMNIIRKFFRFLIGLGKFFLLLAQRKMSYSRQIQSGNFFYLLVQGKIKYLRGILLGKFFLHIGVGK